MKSVPGEKVWKTFYALGNYTEMGISCIFRNGEWVRRERQALSAVTALVTWLGLIGTTAVSLGAACPALALAGTRYEKK